MITITPQAAERIAELLAEKGAGPDEGLRLFVEKGGCSGMQYGMALGPAEADDESVSAGAVQVHVASGSRPHLEGLTLDYHNGLTGAGFRIHNPNAVRSCGCGTSFEPAVSSGQA